MWNVGTYLLFYPTVVFVVLYMFQWGVRQVIWVTAKYVGKYQYDMEKERERRIWKMRRDRDRRKETVEQGLDSV